MLDNEEEDVYFTKRLEVGNGILSSFFGKENQNGILILEEF